MTDAESTSPLPPRRIIAASLNAEIQALRKELKEEVARLDGVGSVHAAAIANHLSRIEQLEAAAATYEGITAELAEVHELVKTLATWQHAKAEEEEKSRAAQVVAEAEKKEQLRQAEERQIARDKRWDAMFKGMIPLIFTLIGLAAASLMQHPTITVGTVVSVVVMVGGVGLYFIFQWRDTPPPPPSPIIPPALKGP